MLLYKKNKELLANNQHFFVLFQLQQNQLQRFCGVEFPKADKHNNIVGSQTRYFLQEQQLRCVPGVNRNDEWSDLRERNDQRRPLLFPANQREASGQTDSDDASR